MNLEVVRKQLSSQLRSHFTTVNEVRANIVSPLDLTGPLLKNEIIYAFEFIINDNERYFTFAVERDRDVYFTRPKEGIRSELTTMIRQRDFGLLLTGDSLNHQDVVGKFIENKLCQGARSDIESIRQEIAQDGLYWGKDIVHVCQGFTIKRFHKATMGYEARVEFLVKCDDETDYARFTGRVESGKLCNLANSKGELISIKDMFAF